MNYIVYLVLFAISTIALICALFTAKKDKDNPLFKSYVAALVGCFFWSLTVVLLTLPPLR